MKILDFARFLADAPTQFTNLLQQAGVESNLDLQRRILNFYSKLSSKDCDMLSKYGQIDDGRARRIATLVGLNQSCALLPIVIFTNYNDAIANRKVGRDAFHDEEIVFWLSGGRIPIEHCCHIGDRFAFWDSTQRDFLFAFYADVSPFLLDAAKDYLRRHGRCFPTVTEAQEYISRL